MPQQLRLSHCSPAAALSASAPPLQLKAHVLSVERYIANQRLTSTLRGEVCCETQEQHLGWLQRKQFGM
jgi:hypothetical protein